MTLARFFACLNLLLMGGLGLSLVQGPYSSAYQELWYRWGAITFFLFGALIPGFLAFRHSLEPGWRRQLLTGWLSIALIGFVYYGMISSGGV